jgi:hypothetical protein
MQALKPLDIDRLRCLGLPQFVKCGFAGDNFPAHIFPSIVGRPILRAEEKVQDVKIKVRVSDRCSNLGILELSSAPSSYK